MSDEKKTRLPIDWDIVRDPCCGCEKNILWYGAVDCDCGCEGKLCEKCGQKQEKKKWKKRKQS